MESFMGLELQTGVVIWMLVDMCTNIALYICGMQIVAKTEFMLNPFLWVFISLPADVLLCSIVYCGRCIFLIRFWQLATAFTILLNVMSGVSLTFAVSYHKKFTLR